MSNPAAQDESVTIKIPGWVHESIQEEAAKQNVSIQTLIINSIIKTITTK